MYNIDLKDFYFSPPDEWLSAEFYARKAKNPHYSLRGYAKNLGLSPGKLSEYLGKKRVLTVAIGEKVALKMGFPPDARDIFLNLIRRERNETLELTETPWDVAHIDPDMFELISNWHHYAILSLTETEDFTNQLAWIGDRLGITTEEAEQAVARLRRLGLVQDDPAKGIKATHKNVTTTHDVISYALRKAHKQYLDKGIEALDEIPVAERDITGMVMAIDRERLSEAKALIKNFRRQLSELLETGNRNEVYSLTVQLIPVTRKLEK